MLLTTSFSDILKAALIVFTAGAVTGAVIMKSAVKKREEKEKGNNK